MSGQWIPQGVQAGYLRGTRMDWYAERSWSETEGQTEVRERLTEPDGSDCLFSSMAKGSERGYGGDPDGRS